MAGGQGEGLEGVGALSRLVCALTLSGISAGMRHGT